MFGRIRHWTALLSIALAAAGCGDGGGRGLLNRLDTLKPAVVYVTPSNGASQVGTNTRVTVTFSESMDAGSLAGAIKLLDDQGRPVAQSVAYDNANHMATITPQAALAPNHTYTSEVSTAARDLAGNPLANDYRWSFTTAAGGDTDPPRVTSYTPAAGATDVSRNTGVAMSFSEPMDTASVGRAFELACNGASIAGRIDYVGQAAVFRPDAPLPPNVVCVAGLKQDATDLAGNRMVADVVWGFTTGAGVDVTAPKVLGVSPADGSTNVPHNASLVVVFDEPVYPFVYGSVDGVLFEVAIDYGTNTVSMSPTSALRPGALHESAVWVRDLAGNAMADAYRWRFTTGP